MISYNTKDSFIVISSVLREELYNNPSLRVRFDCSFCFTKRKDVCFVRKELKGCWFSTIVTYV